MITKACIHSAASQASKVARPARIVIVLLTTLLFVTTAPQACAAGVPKGGHKSAARSRNSAQKHKCATKNCSADGPMFGAALNMVCPGKVNPPQESTTCYYFIRVKSQVQVSAGDAGYFRFLIDGVPPTGSSASGADANGYVTWLDGDPDSDTIRWDSRSYVVAGVLENTSTNQKHAIDVNFGCTDTDGSGSCSVSSGLASLVVDVESEDWVSP